MKPQDFYRREVMRKAWALAKSGSQQFGGRAREYIRQALSDAWKAAKANPYAKGVAEVLADLKSVPLSTLTQPSRILNRSGSFWNPW